MLSADELTALRTTLSDSLPDSVVILRPALVSDGMGGWTTTENAVGTVSARVSPIAVRPFEGEQQDAVASRIEFVLTVPHGTSLAVSDRVVFSAGTLDVLGVDNPRSWSLDVRARCVRRSS